MPACRKAFSWGDAPAFESAEACKAVRDATGARRKARAAAEAARTQAHIEATRRSGQVERVLLASRTGRRTEYLVQWRGLDGGASWEPASSVPSLHVSRYLAAQRTRPDAKPHGAAAVAKDRDAAEREARRVAAEERRAAQAAAEEAAAARARESRAQRARAREERRTRNHSYLESRWR